METTLSAVGMLERTEKGQVMGHQLGICHSFPCLFCVSGPSLRVTSQGHPPASHPFFFLLLLVATITAYKGERNSWLSVPTFLPTHQSCYCGKIVLSKADHVPPCLGTGTNPSLRDMVFLAPT